MTSTPRTRIPPNQIQNDAAGFNQDHTSETLHRRATSQFRFTSGTKDPDVIVKELEVVKFII